MAIRSRQPPSIMAPFKRRMLEKAWSNFRAGEREDLEAVYEQFCNTHRHWLDDYALFGALKPGIATIITSNGRRSWSDAFPRLWRVHARSWQAKSIKCGSHNFCFSARASAQGHAHAGGLRLIGDLPFFVSSDSSDVWANPELFLLDEQHRPRFVAGGR
jgi:4-alpha-glucanotransferase